jgi:hypothetical protein
VKGDGPQGADQSQGAQGRLMRPKAEDRLLKGEAVGPQEEDAQGSAVEQQHPFQVARGDAKGGEGPARREIGDADGPGQGPPDRPAQRGGQRSEGRRAEGGSDPESHQEGLHGQDQKVGQGGDERKLPEMIEHQRGGGDLGGQGDQQGLADGLHQGAGFGIPQEPGRPFTRPSLQGRGEEEQAQGGGEAQLEAHIVQGQRIPQGHGEGGEAEGVEGVVAAAQHQGDQGERPHEGRPHHGGRGADEEGVEGDQEGGSPRGQPAGPAAG